MANAKKQQRRVRPAAGSRRRKYCFFCKEGVETVDYKDYSTLRRFMSERGKIRSRRTTGACRRHQRQVAVAIKRAREVALLPYSSR
ncbi:MAG: 30S ribosomal protein S18 [Actinobacteria bacterium]|nr:30S ribosomal protein S18 [Actinomycetota bacterium]